MTSSPSGMVLIDTSAWICFFARTGFQDIKAHISSLLDENRAAITGPVIIELIQGCSTEKEKNEISHCLNGLHYLPVEDEDWHMAGELAFALRRKGVTTAAIDTIIATIAMNNRCPILHRDSDYDHIAKHSDLNIFSPAH